MEKKLIVAVALSILVIITFQHFFTPPPSKTTLAPVQEQAVTQAVPAVEKTAEISVAKQPSVTESEVVLETDKYFLTFTNLGGSIKDIRLKDYKDSASGEPLQLVRINNPQEYICLMKDAVHSRPLDSSLYEVEKTDGQIVYRLRSDGFEVVKRYILHNSQHYIELQLEIKNLSDQKMDFGYQIIGGAGLDEQKAQDKRLVEVSSNIDGKTVGFKNPKDGRITQPGIVSWTVLRNKYFSLILKPFAQTKNQFYNAGKEGSFVTGVSVQDATLPPKSFVEHKFLLYIGPTDIAILKKAGFGLEETVNYGFFGSISKALLSLMKFFNSVVHSWGISIILLAIFLNAILFPLTLKSMRSMQKMQALHPEMEKLKAQCKDNQQKLNKEMMELYKKYKINPLGGCLPMLLQMPIFIALYQALLKCVDLRGSSFLWIKDLSMPDALKIPTTLPFIGDHINILVILMIIAMVIQQKMSTKTMGAAVTEEQKQQQKIMLIVMPVMFGFIFYSMPAGLVLYWFLNTTLTIIEQYIIFNYS